MSEREEGYYWVKIKFNRTVQTDLAKWIVHANGVGAWIFTEEGAQAYFREDNPKWFDSIIPISPRLLPPEE